MREQGERVRWVGFFKICNNYSRWSISCPSTIQSKATYYLQIHHDAEDSESNCIAQSPTQQKLFLIILHICTQYSHLKVYGETNQTTINSGLSDIARGWRGGELCLFFLLLLLLLVVCSVAFLCFVLCESLQEQKSSNYLFCSWNNNSTMYIDWAGGSAYVLGVVDVVLVEEEKQKYCIWSKCI